MFNLLKVCLEFYTSTFLGFLADKDKNAKTIWPADQAHLERTVKTDKCFGKIVFFKWRHTPLCIWSIIYQTKLASMHLVIIEMYKVLNSFYLKLGV